MIDKNVTNRKKRDLVIAAKSAPCMDCGVQYPSYVMDLDHLPGVEKKFQLGQALHHSIKDIILEIAKCEAVCANCHRFRTHTRGYINGEGQTR